MRRYVRHRTAKLHLFDKTSELHPAAMQGQRLPKTGRKLIWNSSAASVN
jgi:hypothetical protein